MAQSWFRNGELVEQLRSFHSEGIMPTALQWSLGLGASSESVADGPPAIKSGDTAKADSQSDRKTLAPFPDYLKLHRTNCS